MSSSRRKPGPSGVRTSLRMAAMRRETLGPGVRRDDGNVDMVRLNILLLALIIVSSLALITSQHQARKLYNELQNEQAAAKRFEEEIARLQVEQSSWSTPSRIERVARERLGMRAPDPGRTRVLGVEAIPGGPSR